MKLLVKEEVPTWIEGDDVEWVSCKMEDETVKLIKPLFWRLPDHGLLRSGMVLPQLKAWLIGNRSFCMLLLYHLSLGADPEGINRSG
jgi:hypothetical protein